MIDFANDTTWNQWGIDGLATDPVDTNRLYLLTGMYTNSWDPSDGHILASTDQGATFTAYSLPFKVGGNMPGRGIGERLVVDPHTNNILFLGARSGNGLYKSTNYGETWAKVTSLPNAGTYAPDPTDTTGYNDDPIGVAWITFDSTNGTAGTATQRIFVGVVSNGTDNIFMSNDAGSTWSAIPGQNTQFFPHKGVLSPAEKTLYISYSDGAGPYDGTNGAVYKYDITSGNLTDITPVSGSDLYFGFGGVAVDYLAPGTIMVAALNSWWPDGQIFRSKDSGATWSALWTWGNYPDINKNYAFTDTLAPWLGPDATVTTLGTLQIGWMMESLVIDPFDSDHWLYGTGATIQGGHDLTSWDTKGNVSLQSLADGIEETSVQALISPPSGPPLISAVGDDCGFVHTSLTTAPSTEFETPNWATTPDIDYAGNEPTNIVRIGNTAGSTDIQIALSTDSGNTWNIDYGGATGVYGGKVALSADGDTVLWRTASGNGVMVSQYTSSFTAVPSLPPDAIIASDKRNNSIFYGASTSQFYVSATGGKTFTAAGTLGTTSAPVKVAIHPNVTGDIWVSSDVGLFHSTDSGNSFVALSGVTSAYGLALGAAKTSGGYPSVFVGGTISGTTGYFRTDDQGVNWVQINDAAHGFGSVSANVLAADQKTYGRVYVGTNGRGIFYGDASGAAPAPTSTAASSTASSTSAASTTSVKTTSTATSTSSSSSQTAATTTSTATGATQTAYGQCGGTGWTGPTVCASGSTCTVSNAYYSQCIPT